MNNNNWFTKLLSLIFLVLIYSTSSAKEKQVTPDLLTGKWVGSVQAELRVFDKRGRLEAEGASSIEIINLCVEEYKESDAPSEESIRALEADPTTAKFAAKIRNSFDGWAKFTASNKFYDNRGKVAEIWSLKNGSKVIEISGYFLKDERVYFISDNPVMVKREFIAMPLPPLFEEFPAFSIGNFQFVPLEGVNFVIDGDRITINYDEQKEGFHQKITGELYKINFLKKTFPEDIKPNEPIQTDEKTRIEVSLPNVGTLTIGENTTAVFTVFKSESLIEVVKGKIHWLIQKYKEPQRRKFELNSPTAIVAVRGTEYAFNVEDDGTTTLIVLDGEVEFSDKQNRKTVLVKKNQQSVVKPGELPSEPLDINPDQIPKWWE